MTAMLLPEKRVTPDDLLNLPDAVKYELVDGKLVERHMGARSSKIGVRISYLICKHLEEHPAGHCLGSDASYKCYPDAPNKIRRADVGFIRFGRFPNEQVPEGYCTIAPDLAVEVISPGDNAYDVEAKVADYLAAGVPLVWVVYPPQQIVRIHRHPSTSRDACSQLTDAHIITGEDVLPGFSCRVADFFT